MRRLAQGMPARVLLVHAGAAIAGYAASLLPVPMPWMIGPMVFTAALCLSGLRVSVPMLTRPIGQCVVAAAVGLSLTAAAAAMLVEQIVPMLVVALATLLAGLVAAIVLARLTRMDVVSAAFASIPGGPVEMATLAAGSGSAPGPVAFAQTLRLVLLVLTVPPVLAAIDGGVPDPTLLLTAGGTDAQGAILLLVLAAAGGMAFHYLGIMAPFFLGALAASATASMLSLPVSMPPYFVLAAAQLLLGVWLGSMMDRDKLPGSLLPALLASTAVLIALCTLIALGVSAWWGISWQTMVLAAAPGSVTEMALTAKLLGHGAATVTAFHIVRIFIMLPVMPLFFSLLTKVVERPPSEAGSGGDPGDAPD